MMSRTLYTVERRGPNHPARISEGQTVILKEPDYQILRNQGIQIDEGLLKGAFDHGISRHGQDNLITNCLLQKAIKQGTGESVSVPVYEPTLELIFELIRRLEFKDSPSRHTSFYGCLTINEVRRFGAKYP